MVKIDVEEFLEKSKKLAVIDARSPCEYNQGHIPGAFNLPLFSDEERKKVGTLYKNSGKEASVLAGLEFVGPKLTDLVKKAIKISGNRRVIIHCWRGGMRSQSLAWLLELSGFKVFFLVDGYKAYRRYIRARFGEKINLVVLGGKTGTGKSEILCELKNLGEQIIDMESLANHKGSAFGDLGQQAPPTNEQFENNHFSQFSKLDLKNRIWVEDESRGIGTISIPDPFFQQMRNSTLIFVDLDIHHRINRLINEYAGFDGEKLIAATERISRKLGGLNARMAKEFILRNDFESAASILLKYYDKAYHKGLSFRDECKVKLLKITEDNPEISAVVILAFYTDLMKDSAEVNFRYTGLVS